MKRRWRSLAFICVVVVLAAIIAGPWLADRRASGLYKACQNNEKAIETAVQIYATDNVGRFPLALSVVVPKYLTYVPTCAACGQDTYSAGYRSTSNPDGYTVVCLGGHHADAPQVREIERAPWLRLGDFERANLPYISSEGRGLEK